MFHDGDILSAVGLAIQESKAVLCFVQDDTETCQQWEEVLTEPTLASSLTSQAVALRLQAGSPEAGFLSPICPINSIPAIVVIKNAQLQENLQSAEVSLEELKSRLTSAFGGQDDASQTTQSLVTTDGEHVPEQSTEYLDLQPAPGQMRLPNNAYDALRVHTQKLLEEGTSPSEVFQNQLTLLNNIPIFNEEVQRLRESHRPELSEYARSRLLRLPAVGLRIPGQIRPTAEPSVPTPASSQEAEQTSPTPPVIPARTSAPTPGAARSDPPSAAPAPAPAQTDKQRAQRTEYIKMQREREQKQRDERERIKAQIRADREERRRLDEMRKQGDIEQSSSSSTPSSARPRAARNSEIRVQVRTFDGSTLRSTFPSTSTLSADVRPWIDANSNTTAPYNLKLILTPLPNRSIEAGEEEQTLSDLGVVGSCTLVMAPVRGYVESYTASAGGGLLGAAVNGGYNLVSGTAGMVFGGVRSILGYNNQGNASTSESASAPSRNNVAGGSGGSETPNSTPGTAAKNARVRTLADQRAESARKDQQFYNGNQLNFQPNKDDNDKRD